MNKIILYAATASVAVLSFAFSPPPAGYQVGDVVKDFKLKNIDGKMVSLGGLKDNKGAIVVFTCNHCPFSVAYEDRIIRLNNTYASKGFPLVAINPNDPTIVPEDSYDQMIVRAKEKHFTFPYLLDADQSTAHAFGAARTPHVFILTRDGNNYKVAYIGAIDDNTDDESAVTHKYVESAMAEILAGKPVTTPFTKAVGCTIKWKS